MKKAICFLLILGATFTSCEPLEDINDDINAQENFIVGDSNYTLTDDDYDALDKSYGNFNSTDEAKELIPGLLSTIYPVWGSGSSSLVTYNVYSPLDTEDFVYRYTVTDADYDANPETAEYNNFDDEDQIYVFLDTKYTTPEEGDLVSLTYKFYDGTTNTLNNGFFYTNGSWVFIQGFTDDEYNEMGEGYPNFSSEDEAETKIPIYLEDKYKYEGKEAGDLAAIMYKLYTTDEYDLDEDGSTEDNTTVSFISYYIYDGSSWSVRSSEIQETLQFGHDGENWVPDNTIKYTLASADYAFIGNALSSKYSGPAASALNYSNFDRRSGNSAEWTDDMLLEAFNLLLDEIDPDAEEAQKYLIAFDVYNGSNAVETLSVIKTGGVWVFN
ncbi:hypothetical protein R3X28_03230 [Maribacter sp. TH_r10]|uniref:hypothetical protein n=1 Tax=Maribacter TaxID=252356 RepID=UPI00248FFD6C|nr:MULTISPECIES: hypothetical protein [Maribacter]MDV7137869.1 hypothetical protein [Maribacter sp. TH_r10]